MPLGFIDAVVEVACMLIYGVFAGLIQGLVGVLWPNEDPAVRRLQRLCAVVVGLGILAAIAATVLHFVAPGSLVGYLAIASAVSFLASGGIGGLIERACRRQKAERDAGVPRD